MLKRKRFTPKHTKTPEKIQKKLNTFFRILCVLIFIIVFYSIYKHIINQKNILHNAENSKVQSVQNAEYLTIVDMSVNFNNDNLSTVIVKLKNTTNINYEDVELKTILYDESQNEVATFTYKIDNIEPLKEFPIVAYTKSDISKWKTFEVIKLLNS